MDSWCSHLWATVTKGNDFPPNHYTRWSKKSLEMFLARYKLSLVFRSVCPASVMDNAGDIARNLSPHNERRLRLLLHLAGYATLAMTPVEYLLRRFGGEGRAQMVIARRDI
jgi:hypothetical protein